MQKPAFHIFKILDCYFMFDVKNCIFYKINKIFFDFLSIWYSEVSYTIDDAIQLIKKAHYSSNSITLFIAAIDDLTKSDILHKYIECAPLNEIHQLELNQWNEYTDLVSIELMLAEACNMSCKYCFCGKKNETLMSKQTAQKAIDFLINVSGKRKNIDILFFGGEPLLNKTGFRFALEYASSAAKKANKKVNFRITTNGTLIDDDIATLIYKFKVKTMVSLDGPPQVHNSQCPMADGSNSYNKILNGLSVLQRHDNPYVIRCTMTHHPPPLLTLLNSLDKLAPKEIIVEPVLSPNYRYYNLTFDQDDYQKLIKQNETLLSKLIQDFKNGKCVYNPYRRFLQAINTFKHNDASIFHCGACRYSLNVGADGSLYPCCRFSGMPG